MKNKDKIREWKKQNKLKEELEELKQNGECACLVLKAYDDKVDDEFTSERYNPNNEVIEYKKRAVFLFPGKWETKNFGFCKCKLCGLLYSTDLEFLRPWG